jgi:signal peptidase I
MSSGAAAAVAALAASVLAATLARRRFLVVAVGGDDMEPLLRRGDRVLVRRRSRVPAEVGDVVLFLDPDGKEAIRRVVAIAGDAVPYSMLALTGDEGVPPGMLVLFGDTAGVADSRQWGFIPAARVLGRVTRRLSTRF